MTTETAKSAARPAVRRPDVPRFALGAALVLGALVATLVATTVTLAKPVPGLQLPSAAIEYGIALARALLDISAVATVGLSVLPKLFPVERLAAAEAMLVRIRPVAVFTAATWAFSALMALVLQAGELSPGTPITLAAVVDYVRHIGAGQGLLFTAGFALAYVVFGALAIRFGEAVPAELRAGIALFGLLPLPVTGHASASRLHDLTMVSMELHVVGASLWTGGLLATVAVLARRADLLADALPRFSKLATLCLAVVAVTGVLNALAELAFTPGVALPGSLFTTGYGQLVLAKIVFVLILAATGGAIRYRLLGPIGRGERTALVGWVTLELLVMGLAYGVAVVLIRAPVIS
ncbi:copper resistance D family protein [Fodinicola feengrottensis]|uniref:CopD family protein n=1 Tax=Fodinicola feengrottensis TaxID=435914 RepID=A0ABN2HN57_9ACTN|nr:CopD family protein [Fodinicola feengrottensis]